MDTFERHIFQAVALHQLGELFRCVCHIQHMAAYSFALRISILEGVIDLDPKGMLFGSFRVLPNC